MDERVTVLWFGLPVYDDPNSTMLTLMYERVTENEAEYNEGILPAAAGLKKI